MRTVTAMIPPTLKDAEIVAAVDDYTEGVAAMYAMDGISKDFTPWCLTTRAAPDAHTIVDRLASPMAWLSRQSTNKGAHRLVAVVAVRHWDYWEHAIGRAIQAHCSPPPADYMEIDVEVRSRNLGMAIGPRGQTVQRAHKDAKFYWDVQRPTQGVYTLWIPKVADAGRAREAFRGILF